MKYLLFTLSISVLLFAGCGHSSGHIKTEMVAGLVKLDGSPLSGATIMFHPLVGGEDASAFSKEDGTFVVTSQNGATGKGAVAGEYAVTVSKQEITFSVDPSAGPLSVPTAIYGPQLVPTVYHDKESTPLKVEIKRGRNTVLLELSSQ